MDVDKKIRISPGYILSMVVISIAMFGWMPAFDFSERTTIESIAVTLAKIGAFGGLAMFAWSLILSGRYTVFDRLFRGLDKMYIAHRFFGSFGLILLVLHPLALTIALTPRLGLDALDIWIRFSTLSLVLGYISLYAMLGLIVWSISAKVKHETFVKVHKLLGALFFVGVAHAILAGSVLAANTFMMVYISSLSLIALVTYLHYSIFADVLHGHFKYSIRQIRLLPGNLIDIKLSPKSRILNFKPGQFVYASFNSKGLSPEFHPFSIASGNRSSDVQLIIKRIGDFTDELASLAKIGDDVKLKGPYGGFTFDDRRNHKQLWVAGGIGITPFLSKARSLEFSKHDCEVELVYSTKSKTDASFALDELHKIEAKNNEFRFTHMPEEEVGIVSLEHLKEHFKRLEDYAIYICGPPPMLKAYQRQAEELGLDNQLYFEEFSY
jgi:predicted ferric reductase